MDTEGKRVQSKSGTIPRFPPLLLKRHSYASHAPVVDVSFSLEALQTSPSDNLRNI